MRLRRKKEPVVRRPNIERPVQPIFRYSSNRSQTERTWRENYEEVAKEATGGKGWRKLTIVFVALFLIFSTVVISTLTASPKVIVSDGGQPLRDKAAYEETATAAARSNLRGYTKYTLDRQHISADLKSKYPEIASVDVSTPLFSRKAVIRINQAKPAVILRGDNNSKYILNSDGVAILEIGKYTGPQPKGLLEIIDETGAGINLGHPALTSGQIAFVMELKRQADEKKQPITSAILTGGGGELDVIHENNKFFVKYNLYEDAQKSFGTFVATKDFLAGSNEVPNEYIDVRIPERSYVK